MNLWLLFCVVVSCTKIFIIQWGAYHGVVGFSLGPLPISIWILFMTVWYSRTRSLVSKLVLISKRKRFRWGELYSYSSPVSVAVVRIDPTRSYCSPSLIPSIPSQWYVSSARLTSGLTHWGRNKMVNIFKCIFFNENVWLFNWNFTEVCSWGSDISALVQIMAWRWPGNKRLSKPMMVSLLMHICHLRPQWVKMWYWWLSARLQYLVHLQWKHHSSLNYRSHESLTSHV